jgi:hypothetical protein
MVRYYKLWQHRASRHHMLLTQHTNIPLTCRVYAIQTLKQQPVNKPYFKSTASNGGSSSSSTAGSGVCVAAPGTASRSAP